MLHTKFTESLINIIFSFIEFLLAIRLLLKFLGASVQAPFVRWIYETSDPLLAPFEGMFPSKEISDGFTVEVSALFALITYALIAFFLDEILETLSTIRPKNGKSEEKRST